MYNHASCLVTALFTQHPGRQHVPLTKLLCLDLLPRPQSPFHQKPRNASHLYSRICCHNFGFKSENSIMASLMEKSGKNVPDQWEGHRPQAAVALALKAEETPMPPHILDGNPGRGRGRLCFLSPSPSSRDSGVATGL